MHFHCPTRRLLKTNKISHARLFHAIFHTVPWYPGFPFSLSNEKKLHTEIATANDLPQMSSLPKKHATFFNNSHDSFVHEELRGGAPRFCGDHNHFRSRSGGVSADQCAYAPTSFHCRQFCHLCCRRPDCRHNGDVLYRGKTNENHEALARPTHTCSTRVRLACSRICCASSSKGKRSSNSA